MTGRPVDVTCTARPSSRACPISPAPLKSAMQSEQEAQAASAGCVSCHTKTDEATMHPSGTVTLGCATCHGGDPKVSVAAGLADGLRRLPGGEAEGAPAAARLRPVEDAPRTRERAYTEWLAESQEYIQFVNPGDLRVADRTCGQCHAAEVRNVRTSMMTHGRDAVAGGALQQRRHAVQERALRRKLRARRHAAAPAARSRRRRRRKRGRRAGCPLLQPLPRWEVTQPGNVLRVFERGGTKKAEIGNPTKLEEPGRPDVKLSDRGFGTGAAHRSGVPRAAEDAPARSAALVPRHQRSARRLPRLAAARAATSSTPTIATRCTRRSTRSSATTAARRPSIRRSSEATSRAIRSSTPSRDRSRRASA